MSFSNFVDSVRYTLTFLYSCYNKGVWGGGNAKDGGAGMLRVFSREGAAGVEVREDTR